MLEPEIVCAVVREGDKNIKFFHMVVNYHRRFNQIRKISVGGVEFMEDSEVRGGISLFYEELYREEERWRTSLDGG